MFSGAKIGADLVGTADNCSSVHFQATASELSSKYLLNDEKIFIFLKSAKEDHIFTDQAYISVKGNTAGGLKRLIQRFEYHQHAITNVAFETGGVGMTDQDCELKFTIGGMALSIDLKKPELENGILFYRTLAAVAQAQVRNAKRMAFYSKSSPNVHIVDGANAAAILAAVRANAVDEVMAMTDQYNPVSYLSVFQQYIGQR